MEIKDKAFEDYKAGMKYKDIAQKYDVSINTVKSWASRFWKKDKVATKNRSKVATKKPIGAPKGNKNAKGNNGGPPVGSQNALKHGGYSQIYYDTRDEDEREMIDSMNQSEEELLVEQLRLYAVRERRIMTAIKRLRDANSEQVIDKVSKTTSRMNEVITTTSCSSDSALMRLEAELTKIGRAKTKALDSLVRLRQEIKMQSVAESNVIDDWVNSIPEFSEE